MEGVEHPFADLIGFQVSERDNGQCETVLEIEDDHRNPHGVVHGAVIYALADTGMGGALTSTLREGQICSTIEKNQLPAPRHRRQALLSDAYREPR